MSHRYCRSFAHSPQPNLMQRMGFCDIAKAHQCRRDIPSMSQRRIAVASISMGFISNWKRCDTDCVCEIDGTSRRHRCAFAISQNPKIFSDIECDIVSGHSCIGPSGQFKMPILGGAQAGSRSYF